MMRRVCLSCGRPGTGRRCGWMVCRGSLLVERRVSQIAPEELQPQIVRRAHPLIGSRVA